MTEALIAQKGPFAAEVTAGETYYWCACGRSKSQPFCDGSHEVTSLSPVAYEAPRTTTVYLCGCKRTTNTPLCDGSHDNL